MDRHRSSLPKPGACLLSILLVFAGILAGSRAAAESPGLDELAGLGVADAFTIRSTVLERDLHVYVRTPLEYEREGDPLPTVYLLDGGILFPMLAPLQLMMEIDGLAPEALVVGISYGGIGYSNGNLRGTDYTVPSGTVDYYGGAAAYQRFLVEEVFPRVEARFRSDPARRVILGQSLGGQFVLFNALTRPELFHGHVAVNPAIHEVLPWFLDAPAPEKPARSANLIVTRAEHEPARLAEPLSQWLGTRGEELRADLDLHVVELSGQYHASSAPRAYRAAMRRLFDLPAGPGGD
ncbi:MAG: alpha/beta hydrolase-fold protein [Wenzhouxiangellaceae bacterium]|nr:alpha/beta hydrolase-fold protein [Wenzhouxiangellaceae bacterium]